MRLELELQVQYRKEVERSSKNNEKQQFIFNSSLLEEKKAQEEARRANFKAGYLGNGVDMLKQVEAKLEAKQSKIAKEKENELEERVRLESILKQTAEEERQRKLLKKLKLLEVTEEDRKRKQDFSIQQKSLQPKEEQLNLVSKFFNRPQHKAYEIRAR